MGTKLTWMNEGGEARTERALIGSCALHVRRATPWDDSDQRFSWMLMGAFGGGDVHGMGQMRDKFASGIAPDAKTAKKEVAAAYKKYRTLCGG